MVRFVVMAAGQATRMGQDKLVLPWKDTTVLGHILQTLLEAITLQEHRSMGVSSHSVNSEIYVVARHPIQAYIAEDLISMFNSFGGVWIQVPNPKPLAETIRYGLQDLNSEVECIGFLPGDQVGITAPRLADCLQEVLQNLPDFLVPIVGDTAVSPVFFHRRYVPELLELRGEQGGREVLYRYQDRWWKYPVEAGFYQDVDTPEQYNALRVQNSKGESRRMKNKLVMNGPVVLVRGAGEQASGVGWVLAKTGLRVVMTEVAVPLMVRWPVCFGTAVSEGRWQVEGVQSSRVEDPKECEVAWRAGEIPVLVDPQLECLSLLNPLVLVDAIMAKRNLGTKRSMARRTFGLGPGFTAGVDVDVVVETNRGHNLGRLIYKGAAQPNTGIPGEVAGISSKRVLYSPKAGIFRAKRTIGEQVSEGDSLGQIDDGVRQVEILSLCNGVVRGLLRTDTPVAEHVKIGDVDPRGQEEYCWTITEKARALGGAVLQGILESGILSP